MPVASKGKFKGNDTPSPWTLVFDTETTIDAAQQLRVGFYQVRKDDIHSFLLCRWFASFRSL